MLNQGMINFTAGGIVVGMVISGLLVMGKDSEKPCFTNIADPTTVRDHFNLYFVIECLGRMS